MLSQINNNINTMIMVGSTV
jgi:hypothetical protein